MITLLKGLGCYSPKFLGVKDIIFADGKILKITEPSKYLNNELIENVYNCEGLLCFPGLIDQHVHIIGGGGEQGFASRIPEIAITDIVSAGVTTLVGLLGADNKTKSMNSLLAKARGLELEGITTYIYSGNYALPPTTLTGDLTDDLVLIDKVIGCGEIAIADHRSSQPDLKDILSVASQTHMGGILSGKAGVLHVHVGDGVSGLNLLNEIIKTSELPAEMITPTHINRNIRLFEEGILYCDNGGYIDLTTGETEGVTVPDAVETLIEKKVDLKRVTLSSDANGSIPSGGVGKMQTLYDDLVDCIIQKNIATDTVFPLATENVAKVLKIYPKKGIIKEESDADILIADKNYKIKMLFSMGRLIYKNKG